MNLKYRIKIVFIFNAIINSIIIIHNPQIVTVIHVIIKYALTIHKYLIINYMLLKY